MLSAGIQALEIHLESSYFRFVSIKKGQIAEIGQFSRFSGSVNQAGELLVAVDLSSVDTAVDIRDQRMRDLLFETGVYPVATLTAQVDMSAVNALKVGEGTGLKVDGLFDLHGVKKELGVELAVVRLNDGSLRVSSVDPVLLLLEDFSMLAGVAKLQELAGLPSISQVVPVYFSLLLR